VVAGAPVGVSGETLVARAAVHVGLDRVRNALDGSGELVTEREVLRTHGHEAEVRSTDARGHDVHEHAFARRLVHLDDGRTVLCAAHPPHERAVCHP
jgi:hypothetical protein